MAEKPSKTNHDSDSNSDAEDISINEKCIYKLIFSPFFLVVKLVGGEGATPS